MSVENRSRTLIFAFIVIGAGVLFLLRSIGLLPYDLSRVLISWQMLLIVIGVFNILSSQHRVSGAILIGIGGFFMLDKFFYWDISFWQVFWPLVLIGVGVAIILNHNKVRKYGHRFNHNGDELDGAFEGDEDYIDEVMIFSGSKKNITNQNFRGGKITNIFGGSEISFMQAEMAPGKNDLEVVFLFGGSTFIVPQGWNIKVDVTSIFGGFSDKRIARNDTLADPEKTLHIHGIVVFGGGEIKSY